ncbi:hypothetical protein SDC9_122067 [bioreactor metagenome]|uniref:Uncharacterized protein n=1 Tax=bioreactor metagenome TaxID=1076179 RepID=A0A645CDM0_9ZZZZ
MVADVAPCPDFEEFLHRPDAAGQGDEGVGLLLHHRLALVHVVDHVGFGEVQMLDHVVQPDGDYADHVAASAHGGLGQDAHGAHVAAAVDEGEAPPGDQRAQLGGHLVNVSCRPGTDPSRTREGPRDGRRAYPSGLCDIVDGHGLVC